MPMKHILLTISLIFGAKAVSASGNLVEFKCFAQNGSELVGQIEEFTGIRKLMWEGDFDSSVNINGATFIYTRGIKIGKGNQAIWRFLNNWKTKEVEGELRFATQEIWLNDPYPFRGQCVFTKYDY